MTLHIRNGRLLWGSLSGIAVVAAVITAIVFWLPHWAASESHAVVGPQVEQLSQLRRVGNNTIIVPSEVIRALHIEPEIAKRATKARSLPPLTGCLALDSSALARIPPRFPGEIVAVGTVSGGEKKAGSTAEYDAEGDRPLRYGDRVKTGQLLAVLWSKDLGEKKSEFVDAECRLKFDREQLGRLQQKYLEGIIPEQQIHDLRKTVQTDEIAVTKAENTLRSWRLTDADIKALRSEAENIQEKPVEKRSNFERWARVEIRAPQNGVIVEMNLSLGSLVTDTGTDLFKVAETRKLVVWANVYEDDLPMLNALLKKGSVPWMVRLPSQAKDKGYAGKLEQIGEIIDTNQHTAIAMGFVDNGNLDLKAGQYVTIGIDLAPDEDEIEIPTAALVEDGRESIVFVQVPGSTDKFERRTVVVSRRYHDVVYVRSASLRPGEAVIVSGALLLNDAMND